MKMKSVWRKAASWLMIAAVLLCMIAGTGASVKADEEPLTKESTGSITIAADSIEPGAKAEAYQLITVNYDNKANQPVQPVYTWTDAVAAWVRANYPDYIGDDNSVKGNFSPDTNDEMETGKSAMTAAEESAFYDKIAAAIRGKEEGIDSVKLTALTYDSGAAKAGEATTISNLPMGNYLVLVEGGLDIYKPIAVNLIPEWDRENNSWKMSDGSVMDKTVTAKKSTPGIEKTVDDGKTNSGKTKSASVGDVVSYTIVSDVPNYPDNAIAHYWAIYDNLSEGLTFQPGSLKVYGGAPESGSTELKYTDLTGKNEYYTEKKDSLQVGVNGNNSPIAISQKDSNGKKNFDFGLQMEALSLSKAGYAKVKVTYSAVVNEKAVVKEGSGAAGNTNDAETSYSNNPYDPSGYKTKDIPEDEKPTVYTYGINLTKVKKGDTKVTLPDAEFTLARKSDSDGSQNAAYSFKKDASGSYEICTDSKDKDASQTLVTDKDGLIKIRGLSEGTYVLTETKAPKGYVKAKDPQTITLTGETNDAKELTGNLENSEDGIDRISFDNSTGFTLPTTGGLGTILFSAIGILLGAAGVYVVITAVRRKKV